MTRTRKVETRARNAPTAIEKGDRGVVSSTGSVLPARAWTSTVANEPGTATTARANPTATDIQNILDPMLVYDPLT